MPELSILIVDDNEVDRYLLKRLITAANISKILFEVQNGREAIDFLSQHRLDTESAPPEGYPPVILFLDINMPIMDGFEFLAEYSKLLENDEILKSTVLTMFTSSERQEDVDRAMQYDFVKGYIVKMPRTPEQLREKIQELLPEFELSD